MTDALKRRRRRTFGSLEAVRSRLRSAYMDQAIAIRELTATSRSPSLDWVGMHRTVSTVHWVHP